MGARVGGGVGRFEVKLLHKHWYIQEGDESEQTNSEMHLNPIGYYLLLHVQVGD